MFVRVDDSLAPALAGGAPNHGAQRQVVQLLLDFLATRQ